MGHAPSLSRSTLHPPASHCRTLVPVAPTSERPSEAPPHLSLFFIIKFQLFDLGGTAHDAVQRTFSSVERTKDRIQQRQVPRARSSNHPLHRRRWHRPRHLESLGPCLRRRR